MKQYFFSYDFFKATAVFEVTEKLTEAKAKEALEFFVWVYDKDANPIDELMKKYAIRAIEVATAENCKEYGVKKIFANSEGFLALDGSQGIELKVISRFCFDEDDLTVYITES